MSAGGGGHHKFDGKTIFFMIGLLATIMMIVHMVSPHHAVSRDIGQIHFWRGG